MMADAAIYVSKRLQRAAFALLCIVTAQMVLAVASCEPDEFAMNPTRVQLSSQP